MGHSPVRLSDFDLQAIKELFIKHFCKNDKLWLFGSRVDLTKKGGDIDLYIETNFQDAVDVTQAELYFRIDLDKKIGEQKIDIVIKFKDFDLPIYQIAKDEGVRLV